MKKNGNLVEVYTQEAILNTADSLEHSTDDKKILLWGGQIGALLGGASIFYIALEYEPRNRRNSQVVV